MRVENWRGHDIRFVEINDKWWAVLKDICDALGLKTWGVAQRLDPNMLEKASIPIRSSVPSKYGAKDNHSSNEGIFSTEFDKTVQMLVVSEAGVYEALFASRRLEARKFRLWALSVMEKLREKVGLEGYEVMRMTESAIQERVDNILDTLYWDEEKQMVMQSVTVRGGDVEQIPFE